MSPEDPSMPQFVQQIRLTTFAGEPNYYQDVTLGLTATSAGCTLAP